MHGTQIAIIGGRPSVRCRRICLIRHLIEGRDRDLDEGIDRVVEIVRVRLRWSDGVSSCR